MILLQDFPNTVPDWDFNTSVTLGTFDGVHIGHRYILQELIKNARETGEKSLAITFDRHPMTVLNRRAVPRLLTTLNEKLEIFEKLGINITCVLTFTKEIAELTAGRFIEEYMINQLRMNTLFIGYDHGFGKKREKSPETFQALSQRLHFKLKTITPVEYNGFIVKSSAIRSLISEGNVEKASKLLGADYSLKGNVVKGNGVGKKIGIPTANIEPVNKEKIMPAPGVYAGWVEVDGIRKTAVLNLGGKPTFDIDKEAIETHLIDFNGDLYGKEIKIGFTKKLRNIVKFDSYGDLIQQIHSDIEITKHLFIS